MITRRRSPKLRRLLLWGLLALIAPAAFAACPPPPASPEIGVKRVVDGDTLVLADGRHLRFIGIDAMELGHEGGSDQSYAAAARDRLKQLIAIHGGRFRLEHGPELYDEHGRTLAYLFAGDEDLGLELIREGLAVVVAVPPDIGRLECYSEAEAEARNHHLGIWSQTSPLVSDVAHADIAAGTFLILRDTVTGAVRNGAGLRLLLGGRLTLWISDADLARFSTSPAALKGHRVLVRGWVRSYRGAPELDVHAPEALIPQP